MTAPETRIRCDCIVTPDGVIDGAVIIRNGRILDVASGTAAGGASSLDWTGDIIIPGLVDIHTDAYEKHYMPRPGATWDAVGAALAHDAQCAAAGVTTVIDSLSLHGRKSGLDRAEALPDMIAAMSVAGEARLLRADHFLHLRCEVSNPGLMALLEPHLDHPRLALLSMMDHAPGQRSPGGLEGWREKQRLGGKSAEEIAAHLNDVMAWRDTSNSDALRREVAIHARNLGVPLASHDDSEPEHVDAAVELGATIAEFPVTARAAARARERGLVNVMGSPNLVRGASHGGNLSARDLAAAGLLDALCSDYVPLSMIRGAFLMTAPPFNWSLPDAIDLVCGAPARMCGLDDRGAIDPGRRADLVRVRIAAGWPAPVETWVEGRRAA